MPDSTISGLTPVSSVNPADLFVLEQSAEAKKMTAAQLMAFTETNIVSASATTLAAGSSATAVFNPADNSLTLGIPKGEKGEKGEDGQGAPSSTSPLMDGTASVGTETNFARGDHVHPVDTSRVPTSRTINGKALSSNISLTASDVGAATLNISTSLTIPVASWVQSGEYYQQSVNVTGLQASDAVFIDADLSRGASGPSGKRSVLANLYKIYRAIANANQITFYADELPDADIPIQVVYLR